MKSSRVVSLGLSLAVGACIVKSSAPYPLYPDGNPRPDNQVGILVGPLAVVDGQDVSGRGQTFALLPGCHSFRWLRTTGEVNAGAGYVTSLPEQTLWISVEPGHSYTFETTLHEVGSPVGSATIGIADRRRDGSMTPARGCGG